MNGCQAGGVGARMKSAMLWFCGDCKKLVAALMFKTFFVFYRNDKFIAVFTRPQHHTQTRARCIQSTARTVHSERTNTTVSHRSTALTLTTSPHSGLRVHLHAGCLRHAGGSNWYILSQNSVPHFQDF